MGPIPTSGSGFHFFSSGFGLECFGWLEASSRSTIFPFVPSYVMVSPNRTLIKAVTNVDLLVTSEMSRSVLSAIRSILMP